MAFLPGGSPSESYQVSERLGLHQPAGVASLCRARAEGSISLSKQSSSQCLSCFFLSSSWSNTKFSFQNRVLQLSGFPHNSSLFCSSASNSHGHATHISKMTSDYPNDDTEIKHLPLVLGCSNDKLLWEPDLVQLWKTTVRLNFSLVSQIKPNESLKSKVI